MGKLYPILGYQHRLTARDMRDDSNAGFRHWWYIGQHRWSRKLILKNIYLQIRRSLKDGSTNNLSQAPMLAIKVKFDQSVEGKHWDRRQRAMKVLSVHEMTLHNAQHSSTSTSSARMNESTRVGAAALPRSPSSVPNRRLWTAGLNLLAPRWLYAETDLRVFYLNHSEGDWECWCLPPSLIWVLPPLQHKSIFHILPQVFILSSPPHPSGSL